MIDHTKIKAGDEVQIANGDWFDIDVIYNDGVNAGTCDVYKDGVGYTVDVELITDHRPKFNWDDVKPYTKLYHGCRIVFYVQKHPEYNDMIIVCDDIPDAREINNHTSVWPAFKENLTRHPEGDIKGE